MFNVLSPEYKLYLSLSLSPSLPLCLTASIHTYIKKFIRIYTCTYMRKNIHTCIHENTHSYMFPKNGADMHTWGVCNNRRGVKKEASCVQKIKKKYKQNTGTCVDR
jgi:hypothetical protein